MFVRSLLRMPRSTPVPALRALTGLLGMRWRIWEQKLLLILAIQESGETMANKTLREQVDIGWPGFAIEVKDICDNIGLPNIIGSHRVSKNDINYAIY